MKKIIKGLFSAVLFIMMIGFLGVFADDEGVIVVSDSKSILSLNVSVSGNSILVGGETEEGILAVAIAVYDKTGKNLVTMQTTAVNNDNMYESSLELEDGSYVIKVADYEGGNYLTKSVRIGEAKPDTPPGDNKKNKKSEKKEKIENKAQKDDEIKSKESKKLYFPKTDDAGSYVLLISGLGIVASSIIWSSAKRKRRV